MKKFSSLLLAFFALQSLFSHSFEVGLDLRSVDSSFYPSLRLDAEASYRMGKIRLTVPLRYAHSYEYDLDSLETGLFVSLYPFEDYGFFCAVSMLRAALMWGLESPSENILFMSEAIIGWTFIFPFFYIEPRLSITDIFTTGEESLEVLRKAIPQYSQFRVSLVAGVAF